MMGGFLAPVYLAAILFLDFQAYRYGSAVASRVGVGEVGAAVIGLICLCLVNLAAVLMGLVAQKFGDRR